MSCLVQVDFLLTEPERLPPIFKRYQFHAENRGINKKTFLLHLKECEFRFNNRGDDLYLKILEIIRKKSAVLVMTPKKIERGIFKKAKIKKLS